MTNFVITKFVIKNFVIAGYESRHQWSVYCGVVDTGDQVTAGVNDTGDQNTVNILSLPLSLNAHKAKSNSSCIYLILVPFKWNKKKKIRHKYFILITGVVDTSDKSLHMKISEYNHKNSNKL